MVAAVNRRRPEQTYYCPCCGEPLRYIGFYRCTGCGERAEIGKFASDERAARIRAARAGGLTCDALF